MEDLLRLEELLARARREVQNTQGKFHFLHSLEHNFNLYFIIIAFCQIVYSMFRLLDWFLATSRSTSSLYVTYTFVFVADFPYKCRNCSTSMQHEGLCAACIDLPTCRICKRRLLQHLFTADDSRLCQVSIVFLLEHRSILFLVFAPFLNRCRVQ